MPGAQGTTDKEKNHHRGGLVGAEGAMVPDSQAEVETRRDMCGILGIPVDTRWDSSVQL